MSASSLSTFGRVLALILSSAMSNQPRYIGQESQNTSMPTKSLSLIGLKIHLSIDGVQFRKSVKNFKDCLRMWSVDTRVEFHTKNM